MIEIKRSLWDKLSILDTLEFYPWHKGLDISWSLSSGVKELNKSESKNLKKDLSYFFYFNQSKGFDSFMYSGVAQISESRISASYHYSIEYEDLGGYLLVESIIKKILPELERENGNKIQEDQVFLNCSFTEGQIEFLELLELGSGPDYKNIIISDSVKDLIKKEIINFVSEEVDSEHIGGATLEIEESFCSDVRIYEQDEWIFEVVEDEDWDTNYI